MKYRRYLRICTYFIFLRLFIKKIFVINFEQCNAPEQGKDRTENDLSYSNLTSCHAMDHQAQT